jgi:hypothetical protein
VEILKGTTMARNFDHDRLTPAEFSAGLEQAGISPREFERLTGASPNSVSAWLKPEDHPRSQEPPFWVTTWLTMYVLLLEAEKVDVVHRLADSKLIGDDNADV